MQRSAGLYGSLIVDVAQGEREPFHYDGEFNLLLSDWWHKGSHEQEVDLSSNPMRWIGEPQVSLLKIKILYRKSIHNSSILFTFLTDLIKFIKITIEYFQIKILMKKTIDF